MKRFRIIVVSLAVLLLVAFRIGTAYGPRSEAKLYRILGNMAAVVRIVVKNYVEPVNPARLESGLEAGMVEYTGYRSMVVEDQEEWRRHKGKLPPFGIVLARRFGAACALKVIPGSPAEDAGLEPLELLEVVDGKRSRLMPIWGVEHLLWDAEEAGRKVKLLVQDKDLTEKKREVVLEPKDGWRASATRVELNSDRGVVVASIRVLDEVAVDQIKKACKQAQVGCVLDLRSVAWAENDSALHMADVFVGSGTLASWRGSNNRSGTVEATPDVLKLPVVVVDNSTGGGAELLAASLKRAGAKLVGKPTAGACFKWSLVSRGGVSLFIPTGVWLSPSGEALAEGNGLEPDVEAEQENALDTAKELLLKDEAKDGKEEAKAA